MSSVSRWVFALLFVVAAGVQAAVPTVYNYKAGFSGNTQMRSSPDAACADAVAWRQIYPNGGAPSAGWVATLVSVTTTSATTGTCVISMKRTSDGYTSGPPTYNVGWTGAPGFCPSNSTLSSGSCTCDSGYTEIGGACIANKGELQKFCEENAAKKFTFKQSGTIGISSPMPGASCYKPEPPFEGIDAPRGCTMTLGDVVAAPRGDGALKDWSGVGSMTGAVCDDAAATEQAPKSRDDDCPNGFKGVVNGIEKCIAAEPDKGIEGVKSTSETKADGTKIDTKETTKCNGSVCTTTTSTTTTTSSGSVSNSTTSKTEDLADKCAKDQTNAVCQKTQGGVGSKISESSCQENPSAKGCGSEGADIGSLYTKKDKTVAQALTKAKDALQASPLGSSVSGFFSVGGGGSCPQTSGNIPFLNKTVVIDAWCSPFAANMFVIVKAVLLMLATWMAFRIAIDH